jgi:hypothetical protein
VGGGQALAVVLAFGAACFAAGWWAAGQGRGDTGSEAAVPGARAGAESRDRPALEGGAAPQPATGGAAAPRGNAERAPATESTTSPGQPQLSVDVRLPDGSPAETFSLVLESATETNVYEGRRSQGPISVRAGAYEVHARAGLHGVYRSPRQAVLVPETGRGPELTLATVTGTALVVHVQAKAGSTFGRPTVLVLPLAPGAEVDPARLRAEGRSASETPAADGWATMAMADLVPGRYAVGVRAWWSGPLVETAVVTLGEGVVEHRFVLPAVTESEVVVVRVLGPDGRDLPGPAFGLDYHGSRQSGHMQTAPALRQPDGRWWLPLRLADLDPSDAKARLQVRVTARGLGERRVPVSPGASSSVVVTFEPVTVLSVEISGARGDARAGAVEVELREQLSEGSWATIQPASIDAEGRRVFAGRQPGPVELRLVLETKAQGKWMIASRRFVATSGPQRVVLPVPPLYTVTLVGAPPGERVGVLWRHEGEAEYAWLDANADGRAVADGLPEGDYEIARPSGEGTPVAFRVAGPTEVRLDR